jgi:hypothetical protein
MNKIKKTRTKQLTKAENEKLSKAILRNLKDKHKYQVSWINHTRLYIEVEAKDKAEAQEIFDSGNHEKPRIDEEEFIEDSLEIDEVEE